VDPQKRKESPDFYGYIPDGGSRTVIFTCMMLNCALLLLLRSFSAAMLMLVNKRYIAMYLAGDMALYLLQKMARGDFHYWLPLDGALGLYVSFQMRVIVKVLSDFTGVVHFRGPQELGGVYWTLNMLLTVVASFACVWIGEGKMMHWTLVGAVSGAWLLTFGLFLRLTKKEYRRTFVSTQTGKEQVMDRFKVDDDAIKASVMKKNKQMWRPIRGEVKEWVREGWWRWEAEKPEWFTESWIAKVPPDMIPSEAKQAAKEIRASARRRSIVGGVAKEEETTRVKPVA